MFATLILDRYRRGLERAEEDEVFSALADLATALLKDLAWLHSPMITQSTYREIAAGTPNRRRLARELLRRTTGNRDAVYFIQSHLALIQSADLDWLMAEFTAETDAGERGLLA